MNHCSDCMCTLQVFYVGACTLYRHSTYISILGCGCITKDWFGPPCAPQVSSGCSHSLRPPNAVISELWDTMSVPIAQDEDIKGRSDYSDEEDPVVDSFSEGEDDWKPEYDDWQGESKDFTKKLNAARSGHLGGNNMRHQGSDPVATSKSFHVS